MKSKEIVYDYDEFKRKRNPKLTPHYVARYSATDKYGMKFELTLDLSAPSKRAIEVTVIFRKTVDIDLTSKAFNEKYHEHSNAFENFRVAVVDITNQLVKEYVAPLKGTAGEWA